MKNTLERDQRIHQQKWSCKINSEGEDNNSKNTNKQKKAMQINWDFFFNKYRFSGGGKSFTFTVFFLIHGTMKHFQRRCEN